MEEIQVENERKGGRIKAKCQNRKMVKSIKKKDLKIKKIYNYKFYFLLKLPFCLESDLLQHFPLMYTQLQPRQTK